MIPNRVECGLQLAGLLPKALAQLQSGNVTRVVAVVVDGLGWQNLLDYKHLAPHLMSLSRRRIETVTPTTTAAALTTIATGVLPGDHGLVGYKILNPATGKLTKVLQDWRDIKNVRSWQLAPTVFERVREEGFAAQVFARPEHCDSGLTAAILTGTDYVGGKRIRDRVAALSAHLKQASGLYYLYIDELDQAGHKFGCHSAQWQRVLQEIDVTVGHFLETLPQGVGGFLTADHGMIDVPDKAKRVLEERITLPAETLVGGEGRFRSLYLKFPTEAEALARQIQEREGDACFAGTKAELINSGVFGRVRDGVAARMGDVFIVARKNYSYLSTSEADYYRKMIGQHGGLTDSETGIVLLTAGALAN
ncbi:alkaline phosphatase family protein [Canibacter sp. lx-72]|uniref:alkaline phosphatase family protein n=1 Tax=Canibacter zhuwentaonis TaxID=2837491 RepID=UPI001BDDA24B|nr:alkaline phosphatase family protein [Canibacter zhuwentaonis]MBT1017981.1 alkaline phosphatase family protein [Canibacter zhuwentaonis]MBT1035141.1 alkaline phosphatase family protein [Canibacter zhuwentaonis]